MKCQAFLKFYFNDTLLYSFSLIIQHTNSNIEKSE
jgi:hypothetical protein